MNGNPDGTGPICGKQHPDLQTAAQAPAGCEVLSCVPVPDYDALPLSSFEGATS
jgi:hypothetical protein